VEIELFVDTLARGVKNVMRRVGDATSSATDTLDAVRYQEPACAASRSSPRAIG
jgi:hypothetical protein